MGWCDGVEFAILWIYNEFDGANRVAITLISSILDQKHTALGTGHKLNVCKTFNVLESSEHLIYVQFRSRGMQEKSWGYSISV